MKRDLLTYMFIVFAAFCLLVSIPASFELASTTHSSIGAILLLLVFELVAFGSKLSSLWVPSWSKKLDSLTKALLAITALGNAVAGWNHLSNAQLSGAWQAVASYELWSFPIGAALLVTITALLVPVGQYLFLSLAIQRQRELELSSAPDEVARRELEPVTRKLAELEQLQGMLLQLQPQSFARPAELPAPSYTELKALEAPELTIPCRVAGCSESFASKAAERAHQRKHR